MKQHTLWFVDCDTMELWEILPEFADAAASYQKFVDAVDMPRTQQRSMKPEI